MGEKIMIAHSLKNSKRLQNPVVETVFMHISFILSFIHKLIHSFGPFL